MFLSQCNKDNTIGRPAPRQGFLFNFFFIFFYSQERFNSNFNFDRFSLLACKIFFNLITPQISQESHHAQSGDFLRYWFLC